MKPTNSNKETDTQTANGEAVRSRLGDGVPRSDAEVERKLTADTPPGPLRVAALGLYSVRRKRGRTVLEAYEDTLRAMIGKEADESHDQAHLPGPL